MNVAAPLRAVVAAYFGDLLTMAGVVLAAADLSAGGAAALGAGPLQADFVLILSGLVGHRVAHLSGREAPTLSLAVLVAGSLVGVWLSERWWVSAATGAAAAALAPHFLVRRRALVWAGVGVLLAVPGALISPRTGLAAGVFVLLLGAVSLALARRVRAVAAPLALELEESLDAQRMRTADLATRLKRLEDEERRGVRRSLVRGALTRRLGAVEAIAQSVVRDLRQAVAGGAGDALRAAAERSAQRAERLAHLAAGGRARERQTALASVWPRVLGLVAPRVEEYHHLAAAFDPDLPPVAGSGEEWAQILAGLVENALEAMPAGGALSLKAGRAPRAGFATIALTDTGRGIPPEVLPHVLEPFYTSRAEQGAEGLGLAMVASLVEALDGDMRLASTPGEGTTVTIDVPLAVAPEPSPARPEVTLDGVVLVADDDHDARRGIARMLASFGLTVVEADTGSVARAELLAAPGRFRGAVLDVVMPGTPVGEVVAAMRERRPEFPVLLVSGYDTMQMVDAVLALGGVRFLRKPFTREELRDVLADLFAAPAPTPAGP